MKKIVKEILDDFSYSKIMSEEKIIQLIRAYRKHLNQLEPCIMLKNGTTLVSGDIHGDYNILTSIIELFLDNKKTIQNVVFLGDIIDRGSHSIACLNLIFALTLAYPKRIHLIRGNHESPSVNSRYGFLHEVKQFASTNDLYHLYNSVFAVLPLTLVHEQFRFFFVHGGLPLSEISLKDLKSLPKENYYVNEPLIKQLLWNDPTETHEHHGPSMRGFDIHTFGKKIVDDFLSKNDLNKIIRAHEAFAEGYKYFFEEKLLSLFTSEEYYTHVNAKVAYIDKNMEISIFHPDNSDF
ncbi:MAG: metallophosphoesterase [Asgard group archaeon]|nr:metallophosphoesterase [Asgard group archaeon]